MRDCCYPQLAASSLGAFVAALPDSDRTGWPSVNTRCVCPSVPMSKQVDAVTCMAGMASNQGTIPTVLEEERGGGMITDERRLGCTESTVNKLYRNVLTSHLT